MQNCQLWLATLALGKPFGFNMAAKLAERRQRRARMNLEERETAALTGKHLEDAEEHDHEDDHEEEEHEEGHNGKKHKDKKHKKHKDKKHKDKKHHK